jgi:UDP-N-acetylglucosamine transferase subunit ALG13
MIFLTVGTQFPFDRLVSAIDDIVDDGLINEPIFAQIGKSSYKPRNFESAASLKKGVFDDYVKQASAIVGHAGMGTITMALSNHKPLLAMPRLKRYREVVNDHQMAIAKKFEEPGYILVAYDTEELPERIRQLKTFVPKERKANPDAVADRIRNFLNSLQTPTESSK